MVSVLHKTSRNTNMKRLRVSSPPQSIPKCSDVKYTRVNGQSFSAWTYVAYWCCQRPEKEKELGEVQQNPTAVQETPTSPRVGWWHGVTVLFLQVATNKVNSLAKIGNQVGLHIYMSNPWSPDIKKHHHSRKHFKKVTHQSYLTEKPA